jgi:translation initiation factor IF-2
LDEPSPEGRHICIPDPVILKELAAALGQRPFKIVVNAMELGRFSSPNDELDFDFAARIAKKHGIEARHA